MRWQPGLGGLKKRSPYPAVGAGDTQHRPTSAPTCMSFAPRRFNLKPQAYHVLKPSDAAAAHSWISSLGDRHQTAGLIKQPLQTVDEKGKERKRTCIAPNFSISTTKRSDVDHTELPANTPHVKTFLLGHWPQGTVW